MPIQLVCPNCDAELRVPESIVETGGKCPKCGSRVAIPGGDFLPASYLVAAGVLCFTLLMAYIMLASMFG